MSPLFPLVVISLGDGVTLCSGATLGELVWLPDVTPCGAVLGQLFLLVTLLCPVVEFLERYNAPPTMTSSNKSRRILFL